MIKAFSFTLATAAAIANPLVYPEDHKWNFSFGIENGIEHFSQNSPSGASSIYFNFPNESTGYKIGSTQSVGYGKWLYLQSRLSYTIGYTDCMSFLAYSGEVEHDSFFDGDWCLVFPFRIPSRKAITLGPQLGFAYMQHKRAWRLTTVQNFDQKATYLAGLCGLVFGFQPTDAFALRLGLNFQFPKSKTEWKLNGQARDTLEFRKKRHSLDAFINLMYQISKYLQLAGTVEHKSYSVINRDPTIGSPAIISQMHRTSATFGLEWAF